jgi:hypothetical protein
VQRLDEASWGVIGMLAEKGGWVEEALQQNIRMDSRMKSMDGKGRKRAKRKVKVEVNGDGDGREGGSNTTGDGTGKARPQKRKAKDTGNVQDVQGLRRSRRAKNWE